MFCAVRDAIWYERMDLGHCSGRDLVFGMLGRMRFEVRCGVGIVECFVLYEVRCGVRDWILDTVEGETQSSEL